jgi:hypothetical protein
LRGPFSRRAEKFNFLGAGPRTGENFLDYSETCEALKKVEMRAAHMSKSVKNVIHYGSLSLLSSYAVLIFLVRYFRR